ncbi:MAG: tRNA-dihydrouridine synthase family protein [Sedimentisphaerales bacterium]|nr:tRNA-dihydrouridine synthase family protein [Sedimentisphaerales bacterium]
MIRLGHIELAEPVIQAPLSGYSDWAMRRIARRFGAPLTFSGLMLDRSVLHPRAWRQGVYYLDADEAPIGGQLLGNDPETMARAARVMQEKGYDLIDINFACPAPKVIARRRGGYLLQQPALAGEIVRQVRGAVSLPVTLKLRSSFYQGDQEKEHFWRICEQAVAAGVEALIVHGRSVEQRYRDPADWRIIRQVKRRFADTLVFGSGDLHTAEDALERRQDSGADGVIIARGAIGNPWIFPELRALLAGSAKPPPPEPAQVGRIMEDHFDLVLRLHERRKVIAYFRKFCVGYCRRHPRRRRVLPILLAARTEDELREAIRKWFYQDSDTAADDT